LRSHPSSERLSPMLDFGHEIWAGGDEAPSPRLGGDLRGVGLAAVNDAPNESPGALHLKLWIEQHTPIPLSDRAHPRDNDSLRSDTGPVGSLATASSPRVPRNTAILANGSRDQGGRRSPSADSEVVEAAAPRQAVSMPDAGAEALDNALLRLQSDVLGRLVDHAEDDAAAISASDALMLTTGAMGGLPLSRERGK